MMKYDVFISYSRKDYNEVTSMIEYFDDNIPGFSYWFDITGIESGDKFEDKIIAAIDSSSSIIFAVSDNSINSPHTRDEVMYAKNTGKRVIPVLLKGAKLGGWFLYKFGSIDCIDSTDSLQMRKLCHNISNWISEFRQPERYESTLLPDTSYQHEIERSIPLIQNEYSVEEDRIWKVGDYFECDGKEGVVFWLDNTSKHGKIISLDQAHLPWCNRSALKKWNMLRGSSHDDGYKNTQRILDGGGNEDCYPAFAWCVTHGTGWYLPSLNEVKEFQQNDTVINALKRYGKHSPSLKFHWSSTEVRPTVALKLLDGMYTETEEKIRPALVRAVCCF